MISSIKPRWCPRDKAWLAPLGEWSEVSRRHKYVFLRDERGRKIARTDYLGRDRALRRILDRADLGPTVGELITDYLAWHVNRGSRSTTIEGHRFHLGKFERFEFQGARYADRFAATISLRDLARFRETMESRGCGQNYIRNLYASVLACWRWAARPIEGRDPERLIAANPLEGASKPRTNRTRKVVVPWPTIETLIRFALDRARMGPEATRLSAWLKALLLRLIAESGCRPLEACALQWRDVLEEERVVVIPAERSKTGWRTGTDRILGLTPFMAELLATWRNSLDGHPIWVFALVKENRQVAPSRDGLDHWFAALRDSAIKAGIPIPKTMTLYSLRHSLVTQARQGGVNYHDLALHMGHSEQVAESIYSHPDPGFVRDQFDRMHAARSASSERPPSGPRSGAPPRD